MPLKKLRKQVEVEVKRVFSLKKLSESKRAGILANMLTSLLDMDIVLKCVFGCCSLVDWSQYVWFALLRLDGLARVTNIHLINLPLVFV
jgi:hypothetical protein